jgi:hypothetical protein
MNSFLFFLYKYPAPTANKNAGLRALRLVENQKPQGESRLRLDKSK